MDVKTAGSIVFALGVCGLLGASFLCPLLAWAVARLRGAAARPTRQVPPSFIEVLVPAHDEAAVIARTLASIAAALKRLGSVVGRLPKVEVVVAADGCSDGTAAVARRFPGVRVEASGERRGKWTTLRGRCLRSKADWIVLADAGTIWPETLLSDIVGSLGDDVLAAAPSYAPADAGILHRSLWRIEKGLKRIESHSGGPVSLHGATVCYRADVLKEAFKHLGGRRWLNDDVVLPLVIRAQHPEGVIRYPVGEVRDAGLRPREVDLGRRRRLLAGNREWIRELLPFVFAKSLVVGVLSLRRVFRVFWAYWLACVGVGAVLLLGLHPAVAAVGLPLALSGAFRQMAGAAFVSLLAPWELWAPERQRVWR